MGLMLLTLKFSGAKLDKPAYCTPGKARTRSSRRRLNSWERGPSYPCKLKSKEISRACLGVKPGSSDRARCNPRSVSPAQINKSSDNETCDTTRPLRSHERR